MPYVLNLPAKRLYAIQEKDMNRFTFIFLLIACLAGNAFAADDPMISLFIFQSQMANAGNVEAMVKLGEMYEEGVGTKQDLNKALKMYQQAQAKGAKGATASIKRVIKKKRYGSAASKRAAQQKAAREKAAREKALREKAAREKATREKAARDKAAHDKAVRERLARNKAIKEKAMREKAAREQAAREKAAREKAAREREQAARDEAAREQAAHEQMAKEKAAAEKAAQEQAARKNKTFTTDPCDTPAARFMSSCRKK